MGRTRDVSKILTSNTSILSLASASSTYQTKASNALVLLNTTSFTAQNTVSVDNVFSAAYTNYKIILQFSAFSTDIVLRFRFRALGIDNSGADYTGAGAYNYRDGGTVIPLNFTNQTYWEIAGTLTQGEPNRNFFSFEVGKPFTAVATLIQAEQSISDTSGASFRFTTQHVRHNATTSFDGFTIYTFSGNVTGSVSVYGYNK